MNKQTFKIWEFAGAIKRRRAECGISLRDLANVCGVSWASIHRFEHGQGVPDIDNVAKICDWLDVPLTTFYETHEAVSYFPTQPTPDFVREQLLRDKNFDPRSANALADLFAGAYRHFANA